ncbi:MAG: hypothetical protein A3I24_02515 [Candidatus Harrisonbacteria bacterium RIFCSPLOWO2_02_FULL_41_13b]|uniref:Uncharacterized protein n=1 Tax=Candidatus Harrisonbacteria bacterium RIFCSPLOWO2_02_FULL_41_13b TaxID=1798409 RepID=A0A1G1ZWH7_9BACT|nr:MAG: hypothetical protein A3J53_02430 [Candidatus Harrisonbacteria bacterium RIFCSPHIGHO2_02_FULL_40_20]OGY68120.1 MAG: hypothetical protein A3I24_02515 [Candidatus Harrisonbacteria bacterium RIFCSPLOWO2_02_FULL_41_13b]
MDELIEVLSVWPKQRDPAKPPFFVDDRHDLKNPTIRDFAVAGTFRTGVTSYCAIPRNSPSNFHDLHDWFKATKIARILNQLHAEGRINWNTETIAPQIVNPENLPEI